MLEFPSVTLARTPAVAAAIDLIIAEGRQLGRAEDSLFQHGVSGVSIVPVASETGETFKVQAAPGIRMDSQLDREVVQARILQTVTYLPGHLYDAVRYTETTTPSRRDAVASAIPSRRAALSITGDGEMIAVPEGRNIYTPHQFTPLPTSVTPNVWSRLVAGLRHYGRNAAVAYLEEGTLNERLARVRKWATSLTNGPANDVPFLLLSPPATFTDDTIDTPDGHTLDTFWFDTVPPDLTGFVTSASHGDPPVSVVQVRAPVLEMVMFTSSQLEVIARVFDQEGTSGWASAQRRIRERYPDLDDEYGIKRVRHWLARQDATRLDRARADADSAMLEADRHRERYVRAGREALEKMAAYDLMRRQPEATTGLDFVSVQLMLDNGTLTSIDIDEANATLIAKTRTLYARDDRSGAWHEMGKYTIHVGMTEGTLHFQNNSRTVHAYETDMHHPHVFRSGRPCVGDFADAVADLTIRKDWVTLIQMAIAFLESANTRDSAGRHIHRWPFVDDPEEVGLPPYSGEVNPWEEPDYDDDDDGDDDDDRPDYIEHGGLTYWWDADHEEYLYLNEWRRNATSVHTESYYDDDGYDRAGFNPDGWDRDGCHVNTGTGYDEDGYDEEGYNEDGFNYEGYHQNTGTRYDEDGYDRNGYNEDGFDSGDEHRVTGTEYDPEGYDRDGYDEQGFNRDHIHRETDTEYDPDGFDYNETNADGFDTGGIHQETGTPYDDEGYDINGFSERGWNREGLHSVTGSDRDPLGFNIYGYDEEGFDREGRNPRGFSRADSIQDAEAREEAM